MAEHEELRAALGRLRPEERQALAVRWGENAGKWAGTHPHMATVWSVLHDLVLDVDRMERARAAAYAHAERTPMRHAAKGRR